MRHGLLLLTALCLPTFIHTEATAQEPVFGGQLLGSLDPADPAQDGSTVHFTAAGDFSTNTQPFLLGRVDFKPCGASQAYVFTAGLEVASIDGTPYMAFFTTQVPLVDVPTGSVVAKGLDFRGESDVAELDGHQYRLELLGVTQGESFTNPQDGLTAPGGHQETSGYLWGRINDQTDIYTTQHHCHDTPEPATWLLAVVGVIGGLVWQWRRRSAIASV